MNSLQNATFFLVEAILNIVLYIVIIRFWMQWVRANFHNELGQFIIRVTNPVVMPMRKVIPSFGTIDTSTLLLAYFISLLKIIILVSLSGGASSIGANLNGFMIMAVGALLQACIYLFVGAIFVSIIASWVAPHSYHPIPVVCRSISEPLLAPARRVIPPIAGLDLSPIVVLLLLQFLARLLPPLFGFG